ncbi:MAG TPA: tRNA lysidine(34) synthetase TilS [Thermoanaerobaculia bacterium]|nr:tRNA lysidine(34) synthetase TilS [Thermoanaerobaculia bacterium]
MSSPLHAAIARFFAEEAIGPSHLLVAVSGGIDSTALLLALAEFRDSGFTISAAHVNHQLRGAESESDEAFVRRLCNDAGIPLRVADGTLDPERVRHRGIEAAAREVRFARLQQLRAAAGADWIVTAHQQNDQAETVLMRLASGGGLGALRAIRRKRDDCILRPMLDVGRETIEAFLADRGIVAHSDRSNADLRFARNRVRHEILPSLLNVNPGAIASLAGIARDAEALWRVVDDRLDIIERESVTYGDDEARLDPGALPEDLWLRGRLILRIFWHLDPDARNVSSEDLLRLAGGLASIRRISVTKHIELAREGQVFVFRPRSAAASAAEAAYELAIAPGASVWIPAFEATLTLGRAAAGAPIVTADPNRQLFQIPRGMEPRFSVRNRRSGDRIPPLGLGGEKKLTDLLIDRKIDAVVRDRIPLLLCCDEIVWVAGVAVSERFKVTDPAGESFEAILERARDSDHTGRIDIQR